MNKLIKLGIIGIIATLFLRAFLSQIFIVWPISQIAHDPTKDITDMLSFLGDPFDTLSQRVEIVNVISLVWFVTFVIILVIGLVERKKEMKVQKALQESINATDKSE